MRIFLGLFLAFLKYFIDEVLPYSTRLLPSSRVRLHHSSRHRAEGAALHDGRDSTLSREKYGLDPARRALGSALMLAQLLCTSWSDYWVCKTFFA